MPDQRAGFRWIGEGVISAGLGALAVLTSPLLGVAWVVLLSIYVVALERKDHYTQQLIARWRVMLADPDKPIPPGMVRITVQGRPPVVVPVNAEESAVVARLAAIVTGDDL